MYFVFEPHPQENRKLLGPAFIVDEIQLSLRDKRMIESRRIMETALIRAILIPKIIKIGGTKRY